MLITIEGLDGSGKRTLAEALVAAFAAQGKTAATLAFPRYGQSVTADVAAEALHGDHGDLSESVYAMAMLFALDRAAAVDHLAGLRAEYDVVILDRYVASNAAYSAARLEQDASGAVVDWVYRLEYRRLQLPFPDCQLLLDVPVELAGERAKQRAEEDPARARDAYERDNALQARTGAVYGELAAADWGGRWMTVASGSAPAEVAGEVVWRLG